MATRSAVLEWGRERVRVGRWRGDGRVAVLSPAPDGPLPSAIFLQRCLTTLGEEGYTSVVTAALTALEQLPFLTAGFEEHERLRLLTHDLVYLPLGPDALLRRAVDLDRAAVLDVDAASFSDFWQLDDWSLQDAIEATPFARFRVAMGPDGERGAVIGYAISGRTQRRGYLQRLAVHPAWQGHGFGAALVLDGLRWMRRRGVERAVVNTQLGNQAAHGLYLRLGFREAPEGLAVLRKDLA